jgi:DNA-binding NtrC family response regulator
MTMPKNQTTLIVDDEILVLMGLKSQIRRAGDKFRYEIAPDSEEAWEVINELVSEGKDISIIISDWLIHGERGNDFLKKVHTHYPNIHKNIISGRSDGKAIEALKTEINLYKFIRKPWLEEELIGTIQLLS